MARVIGIGHQDFSQLITSGCFYIDKTDFIRERRGNQEVQEQRTGREEG